MENIQNSGSNLEPLAQPCAVSQVQANGTRTVDVSSSEVSVDSKVGGGSTRVRDTSRTVDEAMNVITREPRKNVGRGQQWNAKKKKGTIYENASGSSSEVSSPEWDQWANSAHLVPQSSPLLETDAVARRQRQPQSQPNRKKNDGRTRQWKAKNSIEGSAIETSQKDRGAIDSHGEQLQDLRNEVAELKKNSKLFESVEEKKKKALEEQEKNDAAHLKSMILRSNAMQGGRWKYRVLKKKHAIFQYAKEFKPRKLEVLLLFVLVCCQWLYNSFTVNDDLVIYMWQKFDIDVNWIKLPPYLYLVWFMVSVAVWMYCAYKNMIRMRYLVSKNLVFLKPYVYSEADLRPDLLSLSELKHRNISLFEVEYYEKFVYPYFGTWLSKLTYFTFLHRFITHTVDGQRNKHVRKMIISTELLTQVLAQPVCRLNVNAEATWLRLNQTLATLHTVNEDRYEILGPKQQAIRQNTAVAAAFMFEVIRKKAERLPFPRPLGV